MEQSILFNNICRINGLNLSPQQVDLFERYAGLLLEWNAKLNLISRKDQENLWESHLLHSVAILFGRRVPEEIRVLDVGSGGGLPGIPLAIVKPGWSVTLLDSIGKKTLALQDIVGRLGTGRIEVVNGRVEESAIIAGRRGKYDLVVARGVAPLAQLAKWSRPYLKKRPEVTNEKNEVTKEKNEATDEKNEVTRAGPGKFLPVPSMLAYKGGDLEEELKELRIKVHGTVQRVDHLVFPGSAEAGLEGKKLVVLQFT